MTTFIDFHSITPLGPNNLNRGEDGLPKTTVLAGTQRQRVSSQSLKRAIREYMKENGSDISVRSRFHSRDIARLACEMGVDDEKSAAKAAKVIFSSAAFKSKLAVDENDPSSDSVIPFSQSALEGFAKFVAENLEALTAKTVTPETKDAIKALVAEVDSRSVDVALFGRMAAGDKSLNVDAAAQVAHGISANAFETELDFFVATDDLEGVGTGMMGDVAFGSSLLYRFSSVSLDALADNLRVPVAEVANAVAAFIEASAKSLPTGKQNTFAARALPSHVRVIVRNSQPITGVAAFEKPVDFSAEAGKILDGHLAKMNRAYGEEPVAEFVFDVDGGDGVLAMDELVDAVRDFVRNLA